jgi:hypothetical protein
MWTKWHCGRFLSVFQFPLPTFFPPIAPQSPSSITWGWYNKPITATVPNALGLTKIIIIIMMMMMTNNNNNIYPFIAVTCSN